jgi:hypothetical protein
MTITLYGQTYASNSRGAVASLFARPKTANGTYRKARGGVYFYRLNGELAAFIRRDGLGPVSAFKGDDGRTIYMQALASQDAAWMTPPASYMATVDAARELARSLFPAEARS